MLSKILVSVGMTTDFRAEGPSEASWFLARKAGEGLKVTWESSLLNKTWWFDPDMNLPWALARGQGQQEHSLECDPFEHSFVQRLKMSFVKVNKTRERSQAGILLLALGLSFSKLESRRFKYLLLEMSSPEEPRLSAIADLYPAIVEGCKWVG